MSPIAFLRSLASDPQLRDTDFRRFWFSSTLTTFGGQITLLALPICGALLLHATPGQMGALAAIGSLPFPLLALPTGVMLDRCRRLPVILASDAMVALSLASVPLAWWQGWLTIHWLYAVQFMIGAGFVIGGSADQIFLTFLVGRDKLIDAQAKLGATDSASRLLGPGMAGLLVQALGAPGAILCNVAGFTISLLNMRQIRVREPDPEPPRAHMLRDIHEGLKFVWRHPVLRKLAFTSAGWHLLFYGYSALYVLFATRVLGMSPGLMGSAQMLGGAGVLLASILLKPLSRRVGSGGTIVIGLCASCLGFTLMPTIPVHLGGSVTGSSLAYAAVVFCMDCGGTLFFLPFLALRQRLTPDAMLGRMTTTMRFMTVSTAPVGASIAGALGETLGVRGGLSVVAAGAVLLTLATLFGTRLQRVRG